MSMAEQLSENSRQGFAAQKPPCIGLETNLSENPRWGCGHVYDETPVGLAVYVRNDPLNLVDPDGRDPVYPLDFVGPMQTTTITVTANITLSDSLPYSGYLGFELVSVDGQLINRNYVGPSLDYIKQGLVRVNDELSSYNLSLGVATSISAIKPSDPDSREKLCAQEAILGFALSWVPLGTGWYDFYYDGKGFSGLLGSGVNMGKFLVDISKDAKNWEPGIENLEGNLHGKLQLSGIQHASWCAKSRIGRGSAILIMPRGRAKG